MNFLKINLLFNQTLYKMQKVIQLMMIKYKVIFINNSFKTISIVSESQ